MEVEEGGRACGGRGEREVGVGRVEEVLSAGTLAEGGGRGEPRHSRLGRRREREGEGGRRRWSGGSEGWREVDVPDVDSNHMAQAASLFFEMG